MKTRVLLSKNYSCTAIHIFCWETSIHLTSLTFGTRSKPAPPDLQLPAELSNQSKNQCLHGKCQTKGHFSLGELHKPRTSRAQLLPGLSCSTRLPNTKAHHVTNTNMDSIPGVGGTELWA